MGSSERLEKSINSLPMVTEGQADYMDVDADSWIECGWGSL